MNMTEYQAWMEVTKKSEGQWMIDGITLYNKKEYLIYKGGVDGHFIEISKDGLLSIGTYEGALPHIGDAIFQIRAKKQYASQEEAIMRAITGGKMEFLRDLNSMPYGR